MGGELINYSYYPISDRATGGEAAWDMDTISAQQQMNMIIYQRIYCTTVNQRQCPNSMHHVN